MSNTTNEDTYTIYGTSPLTAEGRRSYLSTLQSRVKAWTNLTKSPNKKTFNELTLPLNITVADREKLWLIVAYCNYRLEDHEAFFNHIMEIAIEERVTFTSFATVEALRQWPTNTFPDGFNNDILLFLYFCMRDGPSAYEQLSKIPPL